MLAKLSVAGAGLAAAAALVPAAAPATAPTAVERSVQRSVEVGVVAQVNVVRRAHGLSALRINPSLNAAAAVHSRDMAANGYFEHESSDGSPFWRRLERFYGSGGRSLWSVGENILWAATALDAKTVVAEWMESRNIATTSFRRRSARSGSAS